MIGSDSEQQRRAAQNQALFRDVNERVEDLNETLRSVTPRGEWICECAAPECFERLEMSLEEYEGVRGEATWFAVAPDTLHFYPEVEVIVDKTDRYWIVRKVGEAAGVAIELDPRRQPGLAG
jgi:hypothetical protein